jgi:hypothetical protein
VFLIRSAANFAVLAEVAFDRSSSFCTSFSMSVLINRVSAANADAAYKHNAHKTDNLVRNLFLHPIGL